MSDQPSPEHEPRAVPRDPRADRITRLAARALGAPAAALWVPRFGLVLAGGHGLEGLSVRLDELALEVDRPALVPDVAVDPRPDDPETGERLTLPGAAPPSVGVARRKVRGCAIAPVSDPSGRRLGVLAVLDVEPRAWTEADGVMLEEHAALLGEVLESVPGEQRLLAAATAQLSTPLLLTEAGAAPDQGSRIVYVNPAFTRAMGYPPEEALGRTPGFLQASGTSREELQRLAAAVARGEAADAAVIQRRKDGSEIPAQLTISPLRDEQGRLTHLVTLLNRAPSGAPLERAVASVPPPSPPAVSSRPPQPPVSQSEAELRVSEERYRQIFAIAGEGIYILRTDGVIVDANAAAAAMHGYTVAQILGRTQMDLDAPEVVDGTPANIKRMGHGEWIEGESIHLRRDGVRFPVAFSAGPLDVGGERFILKFARDITERKRADEALREAKKAADAASRAKSAFLANMSHEIRTPMNAILGYTQLLQRDAALGRDQQIQLDVISRSGEHLLNLMNDVLEMSRIEVGFRKLNRDDLDLGQLLDELERVFRARAEVKRLTLSVTRSPALPRHIVTDGDKLRQVLGNLLSNAVKFTEHGSVQARTFSIPGDPGAPRLVVEVEDTGVGIAAHEMDELFRPFAQARVGILAQGGTGLGLAISRELARLLGGDITVESRAGKGSTFRLEIPYELGHAPSSKRTPPRGRVLRTVGAGVRVLVVDADPDNRSWVQRLLEQVGFDVRGASQGDDALAHFREWHPHLVLMDMHVPAQGQAAIRAIRAEPTGRRAAVVAISSSAFEEDLDVLTGAGADGVLCKPCREGDLLEEIRKQLGIEYTYADPPPPERISQVPEFLASRQEHLARLPSSLVAELRAAAHAADYDRFKELVARIPPGCEAAAAALGELVEEYAYEQIEAILRD